MLVAIALGIGSLVALSAAAGLNAAGVTRDVDSWLPWVWVVPLAVLAVYWLVLGILGLRSVRRGMRLAMSGDFAGASERLRRFQDREVLLRLVGMPGWTFRQARVAEAATYWMHGMTAEAFSIAAEESRGSSAMSRASAAIAAAAAADLPDPHALARLASWVARAKANPARREHASILVSLGCADLHALALDAAEAKAESLLAVDEEHRGALALRAAARLLRGDHDGGDADLDRARSAAAGDPSNPFAIDLVDASRAEAKRARGDLAGAARIAAELATRQPWHRGALLAIAAHADDPRQGRDALEDLARRFSFDAVFAASAALALARLDRRLGDPGSAAARLAPALASPHADVRQAALTEQALCHEALGDATGARAAWEACAALSAATKLGRESAAKIGAAAVTETARPA